MDEKKTAVVLTENPPRNVPSVAKLLGVDTSTIYLWLQQYRAMSDSEREEFIRDKRKTCAPMWAALEEMALVRAMVETLEGSAMDARSSTVSAGIAKDKLVGTGEPKDVTPASPASPSLLREIPGLPSDKQPQEG